MTALQSTADEPSRPQVHVTLQSATVQEGNVDQQLIITIEV